MMRVLLLDLVGLIAEAGGKRILLEAKLGTRYLVVLAAIVLLGAGCGNQDQYENQDGQYEGAEPTAMAGGGFSEEACLKESGESESLGVEISEPNEVPTYEVTGESDTDTGKEFEVVTEAKSSEELKKVAEKIRYEHQDLDAFSVDFFNEAAEGERQDAGLALVFNTRKAACRSFEYPVKKQDEIVSQSNGITAISVEEGV